MYTVMPLHFYIIYIVRIIHKYVLSQRKHGQHRFRHLISPNWESCEEEVCAVIFYEMFVHLLQVFFCAIIRN